MRSLSPHSAAAFALAFATVLGLGLRTATAVRGEVVTVPCVRDNTLFEDADGDTSSGAGNSLYAGRNGQARARRAVLRFALGGLVPAGASVEQAILTLHVASAPDTVAHSFAVHRLLRDWGEGASAAGGGSGAPAAPGDATWIHASYPGEAWAQPGGDFEPAPSATAFLVGVGPGDWSGAGLVADVEAWLAHPESNFGWLVRGDESLVRSVRRFDAREADDPARHPFLTLHLAGTLPAPAHTWGRLKAAYR
jgi:hypothetical protein